MKPLMFKIASTSLVFGITVSLGMSLTHASEFDTYLQQQNTQYMDADRQFQEEQEKLHKEFEQYRKTILEAYQKYRQEVAKYWGEEDAKLSTNKQWVEYADHLQQRSVVDFEKGEAKVQVVLPVEAQDNQEAIQEKLEEAIVNTVTAQADDRSVLELAKHPYQEKNRNSDAPDSAPILANQVVTKAGEKVTADNAKQFAAETIKQQKIKVAQKKGDDGKMRVVATAGFTLIPNHIKVRADKFKHIVNKQATDYDVDKKLVYAVIETESFFNPMARSYVPAFGLMQLVPHYGAREAYRYVYNKDKVVSDSFLYDASNNVKLGSAYLHVLYYKHMNGVKNPQARLYCSIAAYNTGPTNVFSAFVGKYQRSVHRRYDRWKESALKVINSLTAEQLYAKLRRDLPYKETRTYLYKVRHRMPKYAQM